METTNLLESPLVIGVLVLVGLLIVLKLLGLAMKAITVIMLLAAAGFVFYIYSSGSLP